MLQPILSWEMEEGERPNPITGKPNRVVKYKIHLACGHTLVTGNAHKNLNKSLLTRKRMKCEWCEDAQCL